MAERTLDTSGFVTVLTPHANGGVVGSNWHWPDLDAFTQGYVEALFASGIASASGERTRIHGGSWAFSDLAPETLALILRDCAALAADWPLVQMPSDIGATYWRNRQAGRLLTKGFPPLTPYLGDDDKVYLRVAA